MVFLRQECKNKYRFYCLGLFIPTGSREYLQIVNVSYFLLCCLLLNLSLMTRLLENAKHSLRDSRGLLARKLDSVTRKNTGYVNYVVKCSPTHIMRLRKKRFIVTVLQYIQSKRLPLEVGAIQVMIESSPGKIQVQYDKFLLAFNRVQAQMGSKEELE